MAEINLLVPNAIVFLYDVASKNIQVPEYVDNQLVAANESCISVGTQADVDGEVTIRLSNRIEDSDKKSNECVFDGLVSTPGKKIAISTSEDDAVLEIDVSGETAQVGIWVDDVDFPSLILVESH